MCVCGGSTHAVQEEAGMQDGDQTLLFSWISGWKSGACPWVCLELPQVWGCLTLLSQHPESDK